MNANKVFRRLIHKTEFYLFIVFVIICIAIQIASGGQLFEAYTMVNIARAYTILGMFALINLTVVISGGFDLSFPTLASLSCSVATDILLRMGWGTESVWAAFLISGAVGMMLGMLNGFLIAHFKLNAMLVTLGTQTLFLSLSQGPFQFREVTSTLPQGLKDFGEKALFEVFSSAGLRSAMPVAFLPFIVFAVLIWFILNRTMFGRSLYAIGGNEISAERAGINVKRTKFRLFAFVGFAAGLTGMLRVCMVRQVIPRGLNGWDLRVIPIVILGGASIYGGVGTVCGTLIAVALVTVVSNSLLLVGIGSYWQDFFYGLVILTGVTVSAIQAKRRNI